jgi:exodeoxyribonuclease VII small subunit
MSAEGPNTAAEPSFSAAIEELEGILKGIEDEAIDIDVLGTELERAARLLELCRSKIRRAELEVSQIVQSLDEASERAADGADEAGEDVEEQEEELPF